MKRLLSAILCVLTASALSLTGFCGDAEIGLVLIDSGGDSYFVSVELPRGENVCGGNFTLSCYGDGCAFEGCYISDEISAQVNPNYKGNEGQIRVSFSSAKPIDNGSGFICFEFKRTANADTVDFKITEYRLYDETGQCIAQGEQGLSHMQWVDASSPGQIELPDMLKNGGYVKKSRQELADEAAVAEVSKEADLNGGETYALKAGAEQNGKTALIVAVSVLAAAAAVIILLLVKKARHKKEKNQ